ncbi:MAG TPA: alpha/beta fold hydrolase [Thiobacillus sp.]|nr:alpha/beta fold hydrolase [Thiobacillus sp.]
MTDETRDRLVEELHFRSGPYQLFGKFRLQDTAAPTIVLLHGLGFHSFEYDLLAPLLARGGFNSLAFDHRCHGRSEGPRGHWRLQELVDDATCAIDVVARRTSGPLGLFGNSMGAIVGLYAAIREPRVGSLTVSSCPTRVADFASTPFRRSLLGLMQASARVVPLRISVNHFIPYRRILLKKSVVQRVRHDPLIADARRFAPSTYADMFEWNAMPIIGDIRIPLLVLYALHDGLQPPEQSTMLFDAARCQKEIRALDTGHVPDLENPDLLAPILIEWFERTLCQVQTANEKSPDLKISEGVSPKVR